MNWQPTANMEALRFRAEVLTACREFFQQRGVLEVTTPALSAAATTEPNISSFQVLAAKRPAQPLYLHTSPELPMKRLLAAGSGPIYQICQVFRDSDRGRHHRPEFTMLEWYRPGWNHHRLIEEVEQLVRALPGQHAPSPGSHKISYRDLFRQYLALDPFTAGADDCRACAGRHGLPVPDDMGGQLDPWLDLLLSALIAPRLAADALTFIYDFPASQAALARLRNEDGVAVAERFELYWGAVELANGFHELTDAGQQRERFLQDNVRRSARQQPAMPIDQRFLQAMQSGLPECSGVALGIDRLLMALSGVRRIEEVIAFADEF